MNQLQALLIKEFKEAFRDIKALMLALLMAFMAPAVIVAFSKFMISQAIETPPIYIKITGAEYAPTLLARFQANQIFPFEQVPEDKYDIWDQHNIQLKIPDNFQAQLTQGKPIEIILKTDLAAQGLTGPLRRIRQQIYQLSQEIGQHRLLLRGIDLKIIQAITLVEQDTAPVENNSKLVTSMLGLYLIMAAFACGLSIAVDSSAGERERNVLEMLLCQPVAASKLVFAKLTCASSVSFLGVVLTLGLTVIAIRFVDLSDLGANFSLDFITILLLLLLLLPMCFFASALQLFVSFYAKTFKEAQSTVNMTIIVPTLVPFALMFINDKPPWLDWLPIAGQTILIEKLFKGTDINLAILSFTSLTTIGFTLALVWFISHRLESEKAILSL